MADEEKKIVLSAENNTKAGVDGAIAEFRRLKSSTEGIARQVIKLSNGMTVSLDGLANAGRRGQAAQEEVLAKVVKNYLEGGKAAQKFGKMQEGSAFVTAAAAEKAKSSLQALGSGGQKAVEGIATGSKGAASSLMGMALQAGAVGTAIEVARRAFLGWAKFDTQLRLTQNETGLTRAAIDSLGESMRDLAGATGDSKEDLLKAFNELRNASGYTVADVKKIFSEVTVAAAGVGADVVGFSHAMGDVLRNFKIPAEQAKFVWEAMSHVAGKYSLNLNEIGPRLSSLTEMMSAWGWSGVDGAQRMATYLGVVKEATGDATKAAQDLTRIVGGLGNKQMSDLLGFNSVREFDEDLRSAKDPLGRFIWLISQATNQFEIWEALGIRDRAVINKLKVEWGGLGDKIKETQNATGALAKGKNILDGPERSVARLSEAIVDLTQSLGYLLDAFGATWLLKDFAKTITDITRGAYRLVDLFKWALPGGERPEWLKSMEEITYNKSAPRNEATGELLVPYDAYEAGADVDKIAQEYQQKQAEEARVAKNNQKKRAFEAQQKRDAELRAQGLNPPTRAPLVLDETPAPAPPRQSIFERRRGAVTPKTPVEKKAEKLSELVDETTAKLVNYTTTMPDQNKAALIRASLSGGGYGGSGDARLLNASYTPSGHGFVGGSGGYGGGGGVQGAGPSGTGTGYGGGTGYAPAAGGGAGVNSTGGGDQGRRASGQTGERISAAKAAMKDQLIKEGVPAANAEEAANLLAGQGLSESELNPTLSHDSGTGHGIYGARLGRRTAMHEWLDKHGYDRNSLEGQSRYMASEALSKDSRGNYKYPQSARALINANKDNRAGNVRTLTKEFEAPADQGQGQMDRRLGRTNQAAGYSSDAPAATAATGGATDGSLVEEAQGRVAATRKGALDPQLRTALEYAAAESGVKVRVTSGGQRMHGAEGATGSHRHDKGRAADIDIVDPKTGKTLALDDPRRLKFLENSAAAGAGGTGTRYMSDPSKVHVGITGSKAIIGQGLGAYAGPANERDAVARGLKRMMTPEQVAAARKAQTDSTATAAAPAAAPAPSAEAAPSAPAPTVERDIYTNVNLKVNDNQVQFARSSMRRQADKEVREARWNSYSDIGAA